MKNNEIPQHIAVIMDGNRRWANERGLSVLAGHKKVADDVLEALVEHAAKRGVRYMTLWAFSTENWKRSHMEVRGIMQILANAIGPFGDRMQKKGVQLRVIGDITHFDDSLQKRIAEVVNKTAMNTRITVVIALNYGGRDEIIRAANKAISQQQEDNGQPDKKKLTTEEFVQCLDTAGIPDPDLIIRTGGEQRLSGFLLWQSEYSELYFPSFYMPDFSPERLDEAIEEFMRRQRRLGK